IIGVPVAVGLLIICWFYLVKVAYPFPAIELPGGKEEISRQIYRLGKMSEEEKRVLLVFAAVSFCWMSRSFLLNDILPALDDTIIALAGALLLFLIPAG